MNRMICHISRRFHSNMAANIKNIFETENSLKNDMPIEMPNPFEKDKRLCILCKYKIVPNYKNIRLLSQFVSRFTGKIYGKHITGLCETQQVKLEQELEKSIKCGLMPAYYRIPKFAKDPKLCDPDNPFRPHRY